MDSVRLGRALGAGTRRLAKTVAEVSQAVTAAPQAVTAAPPANNISTHSGSAPSQTTSRATVVPLPRAAAPRAAARKAFWKPLQRFTAGLWLEVTGTFFFIFAMVLGTAAWRYRFAWRGAVPGSATFYAYAAFGTLFAYFAVTSFVRANRRK